MSSHSPYLLPTYPQAAMNLLPVSVDLPMLGVSQSWNHTIHDLCLASSI